MEDSSERSLGELGWFLAGEKGRRRGGRRGDVGRDLGREVHSQVEEGKKAGERRWLDSRDLIPGKKRGSGQVKEKRFFLFF